jgi:hypothetical protein
MLSSMNLSERQKRSIIELGLRHVCGEAPDGQRIAALLAETRTLPTPAQLIDAVVMAGAARENVIDIRRGLMRRQLEQLVAAMVAVHAVAR